MVPRPGGDGRRVRGPVETAERKSQEELAGLDALGRVEGEGLRQVEVVRGRPLAAGVDDGDGSGDACDCAPTDPGAFAVPGEVANVTFAPDEATLIWDSTSPRSGSTTVYDVLKPVNPGVSGSGRERLLLPYQGPQRLRDRPIRVQERRVGHLLHGLPRRSPPVAAHRRFKLRLRGRSCLLRQLRLCGVWWNGAGDPGGGGFKLHGTWDPVGGLVLLRIPTFTRSAS